MITKELMITKEKLVNVIGVFTYSLFLIFVGYVCGIPKTPTEAKMLYQKLLKEENARFELERQRHLKEIN